MYYGNPSVSSESSGSDVFDFFDDFSSSSFVPYENDVTGGCAGACTTDDSLAESTTEHAADCHTAPFGAYVDSGSTGYCGDGGLVAEVTMPPGSSVVEFWAKHAGASYSYRAGVTIDSGEWGPMEAGDPDADDMVHWLACGNRTGSTDCGTATDPDTQLEYTPANLSTSWQSFSEDGSQWSGQTIELRLMVTDYSGQWCNMSDHDKELWVDDVRVRRHSVPEPTVFVGEEETCSR